MGKKIRRVCFMAGPGVGKSTLAAWLFAEMKALDLEVELVRERVKNDAYRKVFPEGFDQVSLFASQMFDEDVALRNGVDFVVCEAPAMIGISYAKAYGAPGLKGMMALSKEFDSVYPPLYIMLQRSYKYNPKGRFQDEKNAVALDNLMRETMTKAKIPFKEFKASNRRGILKYVRESVL